MECSVWIMPSDIALIQFHSLKAIGIRKWHFFFKHRTYNANSSEIILTFSTIFLRSISHCKKNLLHSKNFPDCFIFHFWNCIWTFSLVHLFNIKQISYYCSHLKKFLLEDRYQFIYIYLQVNIFIHVGTKSHTLGHMPQEMMMEIIHFSF